MFSNISLQNNPTKYHEVTIQKVVDFSSKNFALHLREIASDFRA